MARTAPVPLRMPSARLAACLGLWLAAGGAAGAVTLSFDAPGLAAAAAAVPMGGVLRIEGLAIDVDEAPVALELERFAVFAPGARIVVRSAKGSERLAPPARTYFKGSIASDPSSLAVLSVSTHRPSGGARVDGWLRTAGLLYTVRAGESGAALELRPVDPPEKVDDASFCAVSRLSGPEADLPWPPSRSGDRWRRVEAVDYAVDLAIETDWEYFALFGSVGPATDYAADLVAAASAVYERDISTRLQLAELILWTDPGDPFEVEGDLLEALHELGDHWHAEHTDVERTLAHLLSGKTSLAGGIAYGGVLCSPDIFSNGHWAGGYALSGSITNFGDFRDVFIFSHELGHNFDSRHSHCYNGMPLPGDPEIDQCVSGETTGDGHVCYAGPTGLPSGGGSIMSYCHLQPGGYGNINLWLGREGFYGVRSERVPEKMLGHVQEVAACLPDAGAIFHDGFESGDTTAWSSAVP